MEIKYIDNQAKQNYENHKKALKELTELIDLLYESEPWTLYGYNVELNNTKKEDENFKKENDDVLSDEIPGYRPTVTRNSIEYQVNYYIFEEDIKSNSNFQQGGKLNVGIYPITNKKRKKTQKHKKRNKQRKSFARK